MHKPQQGIDIQAEVMAALAQEITVEIDPRSYPNALKTLAGTAALTYDPCRYWYCYW